MKIVLKTVFIRDLCAGPTKAPKTARMSLRRFSGRDERMSVTSVHYTVEVGGVVRFSRVVDITQRNWRERRVAAQAQEAFAARQAAFAAGLSSGGVT